VDKYKQIMTDLIANGTLKKQTDGIDHPTVDEEYGLRLYGINKWANENDIDIIIHIHFNDYPGRPANKIGKYYGFSIYTPESQFVNSEISQNIARSVFAELNKIQSVSDYQPEHLGVVEDQELITIGANSTLNAAALLIEYGYIYESQIINKKMRVLMFPEYAYKTYSGIVKFFNPDHKINKCDSVLLPHKFTGDLYFGMRNSPEVANLQAALVCSGLYIGPITGNFLDYTRQAVINFQIKNKADISAATGYVGAQTIKLLNKNEIEAISYTWDNDLYYGMRNNDDVKALQRALTKEGVYSEEITGNFFGLTRQAVIDFQKKRGFSNVPNTGYVGPYTRKVLNGLYSK